MKRGLHIRWRKGPRRDYVPFGRDCVVIWRDQFGTLHTVVWGKAAKRHSVQAAVDDLVGTLERRTIIEP